MWHSNYERLISLLTAIDQKVDKIMLDLSKLDAAVTKMQAVQASVVTTLATLSAEAKKGDPATQAKLDDFAARIDASSQSLADAVVANTPTPPPPVA